MKCVLMAGGLSTRLAELKGGNPINKHTLPVYDRPMIELNVRHLVDSGVREIMVLLNGDDPVGVMKILEDGGRFGCAIYYRYIRVSNGPGRQLWLSQDWVNGEPFIVALGDNFYTVPLGFNDVVAPHSWTMMLGEEDDSAKYNQVKTDGCRIVELVRKPIELFSREIVTTTWVFPPDAFALARQLSEQIQGEVHVGNLMEEYVRRGQMTRTLLPPKSYLDLGTPEALFLAAQRRREIIHASGE